MNTQFGILEERASSQGVALQSRPFGELESRLQIVSEQDLFGEYLTSALPEEIYIIAGGELRMHSYQRIVEETDKDASPGGTVIEYGYIPFGSSIGGNLTCYSVNDGTIRWADHSYVSTRLYTFHPETREMEEHEITAANLSKYLPLVAESCADFLSREKNGTLKSIIGKLDLS